MSVLLLFMLAASAPTSAHGDTSKHYEAVTETEYSIDLTLEPNGRAEYEFVTWQADDSAPEERVKLAGTWSRSKNILTVRLSSGKTVTYSVERCLSYEEFGQSGCSPGLTLIKTDVADGYGLKRFGLWDSAFLHYGAQP